MVAKFRQLLFLALGFAASSASLSAQVILLDRGLSATLGSSETGHWAGFRAAWVDDGGSFVGDDFTIGAAGELWIIDTLRTWVLAADDQGALFKRISLYGGVAGQPRPKDQAECACHDLVPLKTASSSSGADVSVSKASYDPRARFQEDGRTFRLWQIEFRNLRWSVPGGASLQFAVKAETGRAWFNYASRLDVSHHLRVFDAEEKLRSFLGGDENVINLQVWGHSAAHPAREN